MDRTGLIKGAAGTTVSRSTWRGTSKANQILVLTGRSMRALLRDPRIVGFSLIQPIVMVALFSQTFASVALTPNFPKGVSYINYLLPAILVQTAMGSASTSGIGLINDTRNGMLARFRSLPIAMSSVLFARSLSDLMRTGVQLLIILLLAPIIFGFDPAGGPLGMAATWLLVLLISWSLGWLFLAAATWLRNVEAMQMVTFMLMFPLMFASSAFVPLAGLPGWVRGFAHVNPMTYAVNAARDLSLAQPAGNSVLLALATSLTLALVGAVLAIRGFRRTPTTLA